MAILYRIALWLINSKHDSNGMVFNEHLFLATKSKFMVQRDERVTEYGSFCHQLRFCYSNPMPGRYFDRELSNVFLCSWAPGRVGFNNEILLCRLGFFRDSDIYNLSGVSRFMSNFH